MCVHQRRKKKKKPEKRQQQKKTTTTENMCSSEKKKKKKKPREEYVFIKERLGRAQAWFPRGVIRAAAWVCTAWVALLPSLAWAASPFILLLFLFFLSWVFFAVSTFWVFNNYYFWLEIESLRLDFHVDATWKKCHIRREQSIKIKFQKLDL